MEKQERRRPLMLWIIAVLYLLFVVLFISIQTYIHFNGKYQKAFSQLSVLDYIVRFYPVLILAAGVVGLLAIKRWALYVFVIFAASRFFDAICMVWTGNVHKLPEKAFYLGILFPLLLPLPPLIYSIYAFRKKILQ